MLCRRATAAGRACRLRSKEGKEEGEDKDSVGKLGRGDLTMPWQQLDDMATLHLTTVFPKSFPDGNLNFKQKHMVEVG